MGAALATEGTDHAAHTVYARPRRALAYDALHLAATERAPILLLGALNVMDGFDPLRLERELPATQVHNAGLGNANITAISDAYDLAVATLTEAERGRITLVIGLWYGAFMPDAERPPAQRVALSRTATEAHLFRWTPQGPIPVFSRDAFVVALHALRPLWFVDALAQVPGAATRAGMTAVKQAIAPGCDALCRASTLARRVVIMGAPTALAEGPLTALEDLVNGPLTSVKSVLLVHLPLPDWHAGAAPHQKAYTAKVRPLVARLARTRSSVRVLDLASMPGLDAAEDFIDSAHPTPDARARWSALLADALRPSAGIEDGVKTEARS